jgi:hypothetical protein
LFFLLAFCLGPSFAATVGENTELFAIRGFGTLGFAHSTLREADFVASPIQPHGAGFTRNWAPGVDSKLGLQLNFDLTNKLEGVLQMVSQHQVGSGYRPRVEWANLKYQVNPDLSIRMGRIILPAFMVSESRLVGYSNIWVRPPVEIYSRMPFTNSDGLDLSYRARLGDGSNTVQLLYGNLNARVVTVTEKGTQAINGKVKNIVGIADTYEKGDWMVTGTTIAADLIQQGSANRFKFFNVGISYDRGDWFVQGEWSKLSFDTAVGQGGDGAYVSVGIRSGQWTPYLGFSSVKPSKPGPSVLADAQRTLTAGLRWDFAKDAALKVQLDHIRLKESEGGNGFFINLQPGFSAGSSANIVSVVIDFAF